MSKDINKLKRELNAKVQEARAIVDQTESLTSEQETRFDELVAEAEKRQAEIKREESLLAMETVKPVEDMEKRDYKCFGEFLQEVRFSPQNIRTETRTTTMGNKESIGYIVPEHWDTTIRQVTPQEALIRPRALVIPAGDSPDTAINIIALDQSDTNGVYSGVTVNWVNSETGPRQNAGDPKVKNLKLEPQEVSGYIDVSDKLLRNAEAAGELVSNLLRKAILGAEERAFVAGDGIGKPRGILGHSSNVTVTRNTAGSITYQDLVEMYSKRLGNSGGYVWLVNRTALAQLMQIRDNAGNNVWQSSAVFGLPSTLFGIPVLENERQPALGTKGDIMLTDLSYYAIKEGSPLSIFIDPYTQKTNATIRIFAYWTVDGSPMLTTPMQLEDGVSTASPFVVLG